ncbi:OPT oligopeptide transporter [Lentinula edodes]|uniref:OPT oligopeptide transporter n=1 Tax=Lentinula edodes TaxID=5353 RepID=A0A1Q3DW34_LENED|nr:OPT oligopeptide transporter [Lentinula edodes]
MTALNHTRHKLFVLVRSRVHLPNTSSANFAWWAKFNYVTSAAFDCGTVISLIFIFFTLQFPKGGTIFVNWWGNTVH